MKQSIYKVHVVARCNDCDAVFEDYKNGQELAAKHAKSKKHCVTGEVGFAFVYNGRKGE